MGTMWTIALELVANTRNRGSVDVALPNTEMAMQSHGRRRRQAQTKTDSEDSRDEHRDHRIRDPNLTPKRRRGTRRSRACRGTAAITPLGLRQ